MNLHAYPKVELHLDLSLSYELVCALDPTISLKHYTMILLRLRNVPTLWNVCHVLLALSLLCSPQRTFASSSNISCPCKMDSI